MARCQSFDLFSQIILSDVEELVVDVSDSESESDASRSTNLNSNGEKKDNDVDKLVMKNCDSESENNDAKSANLEINGKINYSEVELEMEKSGSESDDAESTNLDINGEKDDSEVEELEMENSGSESDDTESTNLDINREKNDIPNSLENADKEKLQINARPVLSLQCLHDDITDENSQFIPVKIVAADGSFSTKSSEVPRSSLPGRDNWEGAHNFKIKIQCTNLPRKSDATLFSASLQKLYVAKGHPFKVLVQAENVPKGSVIKVTAVYQRLEYAYEVVKRCPTHSQEDFLKGLPFYEHFIQCNSDAAVYKRNPESGKFSVSVPYEKPQEGEKYTTYLYKLTCFSSCSGGPNRRPFMLIFTLKKDNIPLGRQIIEAKVCACPVRDFRVDHERGQKKLPKIDSAIKSQSSEEPVKAKYTISVKDPELYLFLKQMKCLYELSACSNLKPDT